ncbi:MAG: NADH-quinone oxidoreductase subunit C [Elusimicrobia bacterium]|nr:NADH-quinone oxidoreductase subunit C [Elusimicrobiota bacterium]
MSAGADFLDRLLAAVPGSQADTPVKDYPTVRLSAPKDLLPAARLLKDELGFDYLEMVTAVDWLGPVNLGGFVSNPNPNPFTQKHPGPPVSPVAGPGVTYRPVLDLLWSFGDLVKNRKVFLRLEVPRDRAEAPSLTGLFPAADWQEREAFDLFGIRFAGHPNLIKILTPDFLQGHPLRKDYVHAKDRYDAE